MMLFAAGALLAAAAAPDCSKDASSVCYKHGTHLDKVKTTDPHQCCAACGALSGCTTYSIDFNRSQCFLLGSSDVKPDAGKCLSGTSTGPPSPPTPSPPPSPPAPPPPAGRRNKFRGVFQHGYPKFNADVTVGAHISLSWAQIQPTPEKYDFSGFDTPARQAISEGKALLWGVETGNAKNDGAAPEWLYSKGVPKVTVTGGPCGKCDWPYYLSDVYTQSFRAMHAALRAHFDATYTADELRLFVGIDMLFGSTGDVTPWHGTPTDSQYNIPNDVWMSYWGNESTHLASVYADWANDAGRDFYLVIHDVEKFAAQVAAVVPSYHFVAVDHEVCKAYQETGEKTSLTMANTEYQIAHTRMGAKRNYILSQCTQDPHLQEGPGTDVAVSQWAAICYMLSWGQDQLNSGNHFYEQDARMLSFFSFFNRYAGARADEGASSVGAWASLRDGLDSADTQRFAEGEYGAAKQSSADRMAKIVKAFHSRGAAQDDPTHATMGTQAGRQRTGMNDCGWDISPDNYHMFLKQIDATNTSVGRWRVGDFNSGKAGQFFGRFARSFDHATGRDDMFFAVEGGVFAGQSGAVHLRVVYYDAGTGGWSVRHGPGCANETSFTKKGTGLWAEATLDIAGPFAQACARGADLVLHNPDSEDDAFAFVELSAEPLVPLFVAP